jgi:hypothetical protein
MRFAVGVAIDWSLPRAELTVSERDAAAPRLRDVAEEIAVRVQLRVRKSLSPG